MDIPRKNSREASVVAQLDELGEQSIAAFVRGKVFNSRREAERCLNDMMFRGLIVAIGDEHVGLSHAMRKYLDDLRQVEKPKVIVVAPPYHPPFKPMSSYSLTRNLREPIRVGMSFITGAQSAEPSPLGGK
jgi:hypothetical protein